MHRWFPILALTAGVLWVVALGSLAAGASSRTAADWAALATLAAHAGVLLWSGATRARRGDRGPEWVQVQEAKHRRKGAWFAAWGLAVLAVGWSAARVGPPSAGRPGAAAWFGSSLNLGFQPGMFLAEWASIVAMLRLGRSVAGRGPEPG